MNSLPGEPRTPLNRQRYLVMTLVKRPRSYELPDRIPLQKHHRGGLAAQEMPKGATRYPPWRTKGLHVDAVLSVPMCGSLWERGETCLACAAEFRFDDLCSLGNSEPDFVASYRQHVRQYLGYTAIYHYPSPPSIWDIPPCFISIRTNHNEPTCRLHDIILNGSHRNGHTKVHLYIFQFVENAILEKFSVADLQPTRSYQSHTFWCGCRCAKLKRRFRGPAKTFTLLKIYYWAMPSKCPADELILTFCNSCAAFRGQNFPFVIYLYSHHLGRECLWPSLRLQKLRGVHP